MILNTSCHECGKAGVIEVRKLTLDGCEVLDFIEHERGCSLARTEQPVHFQRQAWRRQERAAIRAMGIRPTVASGAANLDGDGRKTHEWRLECKQTTSPRYVLKQQTWTKLVEGALSSSEEPVLNVRVQDREWFVVLRTTWQSHGSREPTTRGRVFDSTGATRFVVHVSPEGLAMPKSEFLKLKEQIDADRAAAT